MYREVTLMFLVAGSNAAMMLPLKSSINSKSFSKGVLEQSADGPLEFAGALEKENS